MSQITDASPAERHRLLSAEFTRLIDGTTDWDAPSPVAEWRAADIVDHLVSWPVGFLEGVAGVKVDVPDAEGLAGRWAAQRDAIQGLLESPAAHQMVSTPMGVMPLHCLLDQFYIADIFMHTWDLAKATGQDADLDADYAAGAHAGMAAMGDSLYESGQFARPPRDLPADASPVDKLINLIGRDPEWTA